VYSVVTLSISGLLKQLYNKNDNRLLSLNNLLHIELEKSFIDSVNLFLPMKPPHAQAWIQPTSNFLVTPGSLNEKIAYISREYC